MYRNMCANTGKRCKFYRKRFKIYAERPKKTPVRCAKFTEKSTQIAVIVGPTLGNGWNSWQTLLLAC